MISRRLTFWISGLAALALLTACGGGEPGAESEGSEAGGAMEQAAEAVVDVVEGGYAAKLTIPDKLPDDPAVQMIVMAVRNSSVPAESDVGVPAYPGARIMSTMSVTQAESSGEEVTMLPGVALLATDDVATVAEFYTEKLAGWDHKDFYGNHMFWNGPEGSNPMDVTGQFPLVSVVALDESDTEVNMWPDVKSRIDIRYVPGGK